MSDSITRLLRSPGAGGIDASPPSGPGAGLRPELRAIIDEFLSTVAQPLVLVDREFRILVWNASFANAVGMPPESLSDRLVTDLLLDGGGTGSPGSCAPIGARRPAPSSDACPWPSIPAPSC